MKKLLSLFLLFTFLFSCSKKSEHTADIPGSVVGNWGYSGSDGSFLNLTKQGTIEKRKWDTVLTVQYNRYEVLTDSTIKFFNNSSDSIVAKYSLTDNATILHLSGACFYDCDESFGRILLTD
ncbi:MAG: hypothetical protein QM802_13410 [Agriterribacter sp.]